MFDSFPGCFIIFDHNSYIPYQEKELILGGSTLPPAAVKDVEELSLEDQKVEDSTGVNQSKIVLPSHHAAFLRGSSCKQAVHITTTATAQKHLGQETNSFLTAENRVGKYGGGQGGHKFATKPAAEVDPEKSACHYNASRKSSNERGSKSAKKPVAKGG